MKYFEDLAIGDIAEIGSFTFSRDEIIRFATAFDPQPFHVDDGAANASLYGGLIASGWHVAAVWMKLMVTHRLAEQARALEAGEPVVELGPSPGFRNMVWAKPVRPADELRYRTEITGKKESASRPQWGIVSMLSSATNQHNERVFQFDGVVFWGRRAAL
jgi:acyl dehydratase